MDWYVYILRCVDGSFYTGVTNNIERRVDQHNFSKYWGSKYTHARLPVVLVYHEKVTTRSEALKREDAIKKLTREKKMKLISGV